MSHQLVSSAIWQEKRTENIRNIADRAFIDVCHEVVEAKKEAASYSEWTEWAQSEFGWSEQYVNQMVNVSVMVSSSTTAKLSFRNLGSTVLRQIASPSVPQEARIEVAKQAENGKVAIANAQEIIEAKKAEIKAKEEKRLIEAKMLELNYQVAQLQEQLEKAQEPVIKEVLPQSAIDTISQLKTKLQDAKREQYELAEELGKERQASGERYMERREGENQDRIRSQWAMSSREFTNAVLQLFARWPSVVDAQAFQADDWQRLQQVCASASEVIVRSKALERGVQGMVIDSE